MDEKVRDYIQEFHMIEAGDSVVAGVSGGADSVCLLLFLDELRHAIDFSLTAVHVEHGIRGEESLSDAAFVEELCKKRGIALTTFHVDAPQYRDSRGLSLEEAARELRYECFRQVCEACDTEKVALAHHADDCAETMLFHLARGTGVRGMCGIRPVSEHFFGGDAGMSADTEEADREETREKQNISDRSNGAWRVERLTILRPLLCATREEIDVWLASRRQDYCTDSTNADLSYARNRIRECVLPELTGINAQAVPHMRQLAGQMAQICDYLDEAAWEAGRGMITCGDTSDPTRIRIDCTSFLALPEVLGRHLLHSLLGLAAGGRRDIGADHVEQVMRLMTAGVGTKVSLPGGIEAEKEYDTVALRAGKPDENDASAVRIAPRALQIPGETSIENGLRFSAELLDMKDGEPADLSEKIPRKKYTKWFDYDKIKGAVLLRSRNPGDYLITNAGGGHKTLKKFFIDEKIPLADRDGICLLADGDHILWIVGNRISEAYKVTGDTKRILQVRVRGTDADGARTDE